MRDVMTTVEELRRLDVPEEALQPIIEWAQATERGEVSERVTDSGHRIGDPCEAIEAYFVHGPQRCMKTSVAFAVDAGWGTEHVVCADHAPPAGTSGQNEGERREVGRR